MKKWMFVLMTFVLFAFGCGDTPTTPDRRTKNRFCGSFDSVMNEQRSTLNVRGLISCPPYIHVTPGNDLVRAGDAKKGFMKPIDFSHWSWEVDIENGSYAIDVEDSVRYRGIVGSDQVGYKISVIVIPIGAETELSCKKDYREATIGKGTAEVAPMELTRDGQILKR